jgi:tetratricopeptide (TPR) repeat protein
LDFALHKLSLGRAYLLEAFLSPQPTNESLRGAKRRSNLTPTEGLLRFARNDEAFKQAADYLNQAVTGLREAGTQDHQPGAFLARAFFYRIQNQFPQAWDDLEEAREIAERGEMKLWLVDYHLEASRLLISEVGFRNVAPPVGTDTPVETIHDVETIHELSLRGETSPRHETSLQRANDHLKQAAELVKETGYHRRDPEVELGYAGLFLAQGELAQAREHLARGKTLLDKMGIRCWDFEVRRLEQGIG